MSATSANPAHQHLLVFARHPELGKVKTRLAAGIGNEAALAVYRELLAHTRAVAQELPAHKTVWLAETPTTTPDSADAWPDYEQQLQFSGDLGTRMLTAFAHAFNQGARAVLIVGTDCPGLSTAILEQAYAALATHDLVVGPAEDGGYYLLGMKELCEDIFLGKSWSTDSVLAHTLADADRLGLTVAQLPTLRDVDDAADLAAWRAISGA
ncbi:TIGR04282 family arsenosugar biosynthesis glycosyltransferase [Hymenobacter canadensis]|uniref:TIGR04282 family arsenosugar biosynthesis glycosyltransferase n=1 Tax=Hymenobacter canadensis TaxID=2999067 RepID=A0ABY7LQN7_9BACT|nr:TIGR04282 family arsenosugar biosynthesis glycosyltransferase [Hymenobacter canadensis]WBA42733.1 TIGR04282 family arsenosugar biosynthesis glycosyltransferase [Hymenobacter canadensis]